MFQVDLSGGTSIVATVREPIFCAGTRANGETANSLGSDADETFVWNNIGLDG